MLLVKRFNNIKRRGLISIENRTLNLKISAYNSRTGCDLYFKKTNYLNRESNPASYFEVFCLGCCIYYIVY